MTDHRLLTTHGHDCWGWGPKHYECAVREIERLEARLTAAQQPAEGEEIMVNTPYDVFILPLRPSGLDGNGPRFVVHVPGPQQPAAVGMTKRELFTIAAMHTLRAGDYAKWEHLAQDAVSLADATLAALAAEQQGGAE